MPETKRRIRPVIEEIVEDTPKKEEEVVHAPTEMPKKHAEAHTHHETEVKEETHHSHAHHTEPSSEYIPEPEVVNPADKAKELLAEMAAPHSEGHSDRMNMKLLFGVTIITALVVGFISGGVYVYVTGVRPEAEAIVSTEPTSTPMTSATPKPSASPTAVSADTLASMKVSVLNGSGQIGGAGKVKALLENAGFKVGTTGNASTFTYTDTIIQTTDKVEAGVVEALKKALSKDYSVEVGKALSAGSTWDIVVTVGSK